MRPTPWVAQLTGLGGRERSVRSYLHLAGVVGVARASHGDLAVDDEPLAQVRRVRLHALVIPAVDCNEITLRVPVSRSSGMSLCRARGKRH